VKDVFWVIPSTLAGRCGPDRLPWNIAELADAGIRGIVSVNDGALCHRDDLAANGIAYACIPLSDNAPPRPGDLERCLEALPRIYAFIVRQMAVGAVLVHCSSGKDRTGLALAYALVRARGLDVCEAMAAVREARPIAFSAEGWYDFAATVLSVREPASD
jgi:protein-tyrosine phosphatase